jgi:CheY-like chemotaxis protein
MIQSNIDDRECDLSRSETVSMLENSHALKILVAEDSDLSFTLTAAMIERICGVSPDRAKDGAEACELAKTNRYDLILMDQFMPEMSGVEATSIIRENSSEWPPEVILGLSGSLSKMDRDRFINAGADGFIGKPLRLNVLSELIQDFRLQSFQELTPIPAS